MKKLINHLSQFLTTERWETFQQVLEYRTRYITVVMEDIYQSQNASAVLRSCDCLGIQDVHIIENRNKFRLDTEVVMGSSKWLNLTRYNTEENNTKNAIEALRSKGYRIIATCPHQDDTDLDDFDLTEGKTALLFGTELTGLSDIARDEAEGFLKIPIVGFTESYNISVSAAIIIYQLSQKLRASDINWKLEDHESEALMLEWLRKSIKKPELIEDSFYNNHDNQS